MRQMKVQGVAVSAGFGGEASVMDKIKDVFTFGDDAGVCAAKRDEDGEAGAGKERKKSCLIA